MARRSSSSSRPSRHAHARLQRCPLPDCAGALHVADAPLLSPARLLRAVAMWRLFPRVPLLAWLLYHERELVRVSIQGEDFAHRRLARQALRLLGRWGVSRAEGALARLARMTGRLRGEWRPPDW